MAPIRSSSLVLVALLLGCRGDDGALDLECTGISFGGRVIWEDGVPVPNARVTSASPGSCYTTCGDCEGAAAARPDGNFNSGYAALCDRNDMVGGVSAECPTKPLSYWTSAHRGWVPCRTAVYEVTCVCLRTRPGS